MGRRGTEVPRGTAAHLDKRRPVPRPATTKFASGIAETAIGQLVNALTDGKILLRSGGPHGQDGNRDSPATISLSVRVHLPPLPRPLRLGSVWRG